MDNIKLLTTDVIHYNNLYINSQLLIDDIVILKEEIDKYNNLKVQFIKDYKDIENLNEYIINLRDYMFIIIKIKDNIINKYYNYIKENNLTNAQIYDTMLDRITPYNLYIDNDNIKLLQKEIDAYNKLRIDFYFNRTLYYDKNDNIDTKKELVNNIKTITNAMCNVIKLKAKLIENYNNLKK